MYAMLVIALSAWLAYLGDGLVTQYRDLSQMYQTRLRAIQTRIMAESLEQYFYEKGSFPLSISGLAASSGYEYTRGLNDVWQGYASVTGLKDSVWTYGRMVFFSTPPRSGIAADDYLASNSCGTGSFYLDSSWCGQRTSTWFRRETRDVYHSQIANQRIQLHRTLQKFAQHYNAAGNFPRTKQDGSPIASSSIHTLAELSGFSGLANQCKTVHSFDSVPLDCTDLFDQWGQPVAYQFESGKRIVLVVKTPILNSAGTPVVVAAEYDLTVI